MHICNMQISSNRVKAKWNHSSPALNNQLPDTGDRDSTASTGLADPLGLEMQNSVFVLEKALRDMPNCH